MKKKKWILPVIIAIIIVAILVFAGIKAYDLMFGGTLALTTTDLMNALAACRVPLIIAGAVIVAGIILVIAVRGMEKNKRKLIRIQAPIAMILSVLLAVNWIMLDIEYSVINSVFNIKK